MSQKFAILGAGAAGTLLARELVQHNINDDAQIHIYDSAEKPGARNGRWCLWAHDDDPLADLFTHNWSNMTYRDDLIMLQKGLHNYRYAEIEWHPFYHSLHGWLADQPGIHWHFGAPVTCTSGPDEKWQVDDDTSQYGFNHIFDARPPATKPELYQHFTGWLVDMQEPVFAEDEVILMDFLAPTEDHVRFFYILSQSTTRALIEVTYLSPEPFKDTDIYSAALHNYLALRYPGIAYEHGRPVETGAIGLYAEPPETQQPGYTPIGARGGAVRGSTGYGFKHMRDHASMIARALHNGETPPPVDHVFPRGTRWMDRIFMRVMRRQPQHAAWIFRTMFARLSAEQITRFLMCDDNNWRERLAVIRAMPRLPFLRGFLWPF